MTRLKSSTVAGWGTSHCGGYRSLPVWRSRYPVTQQFFIKMCGQEEAVTRNSLPNVVHWIKLASAFGAQ